MPQPDPLAAIRRILDAHPAPEPDDSAPTSPAAGPPDDSINSPESVPPGGSAPTPARRRPHPEAPMSDDRAPDNGNATSYLQRRVTELEKRAADLDAALKQERRRGKAVREALGVQSMDAAIDRIGEILESAESFGPILDELEQYREVIPDLQAHVEEWNQLVEAPPEDAVKALEAERGKLATFSHRDAWREALSSDAARLNKGVTLDALWRHLDYRPEGDAPTAEKVAELLASARESAPYLFASDEGAISSAATADDAGDAAHAANGTAAQQGATGHRAAPMPERRPLSGPGGGQGQPVRSASTVKYTREQIAEPGWQQRYPDLVVALQEGRAVKAGD